MFLRLLEGAWIQAQAQTGAAFEIVEATPATALRLEAAPVPMNLKEPQ